MRGGHGTRMAAPMGDIWVAMRSAMKSPQTPDCRGGVFAVFAKIPPPIPSPAAHPIEASLPRGDSPMVMSARVVFVATWRAAPFKREPKHRTPFRYRTPIRHLHCVSLPKMYTHLKFPFSRMATALFALKHPLAEQIPQSLRSYGSTAIVIKNQ